MSCFCTCGTDGPDGTIRPECIDDCSDFNLNCLTGFCIYRYIPEPPGFERLEYVGYNVPDPACIENYTSVCSINPYLYGCRYGSTDTVCYYYDVHRILVEAYRTEITRLSIYPRVIRCMGRCQSLCLGDGSVYYRITSDSCCDCCYCDLDLYVCGPLRSELLPTPVFGYCRVAFPQRRRCRDQYCQYMCDRIGNNVYKFMLVRPCPEGCMCKPMLLRFSYHHNNWWNNIYDAECCPATYGSTITIACIDDDDPLINFHCSPRFETCQLESLGREGVLARFVVRDSCHLERIGGPDMVDQNPYFRSGYYIAYSSAYMLCACSFLYHDYYGLVSLFKDDNGRIIAAFNCWSYSTSGGLYTPCRNLCDMPPGITIESLCAYSGTIYFFV
jgi:hypothetical protein